MTRQKKDLTTITGGNNPVAQTDDTSPAEQDHHTSPTEQDHHTSPTEQDHHTSPTEQDHHTSPTEQDHDATPDSNKADRTRSTDDMEDQTRAVIYSPFDDEEEDDLDIDHLLKNSSLFLPDIPDQQPLQAPVRARRLRPPLALEKPRRKVADGLVEIPYIQPVDPINALLSPEKVAQVAAQKQVPKPTLTDGSWIGDQYEIKGCLAYGGLGWIYLGIDHNVSGRWVVLKGLLDIEGEAAQDAALAEREFLAEVTHPAIVNIFNFVTDHDPSHQPLGSEPGHSSSYIVMEYVGGKSLRDLRREQPDGLLSPELAIGYMLEILPAIAQLHSIGLAYNDLKPDNVMLSENHITLIDLGATAAIGDYGYIYGTEGFQAPEISSTGPTVSSDIYTAGRTLASLIVRLPLHNGRYVDELPTPEEEPLFAKYDSLYRLLKHATDTDPTHRFQSADSMAAQLMGVLREILSERTKEEFPFLSTRFSPQRTTFGVSHEVARTDYIFDGKPHEIRLTGARVVTSLPVPLIDRTDPGAKLLVATTYSAPDEIIDRLTQELNNPDSSAYGSTEVPLSIVRALLDLDRPEDARSILNNMTGHLADWRYEWYCGIIALLLGEFHNAWKHFDTVLDSMSGETGPKLALAATAELIVENTSTLSTDEIASWRELARGYYSTVWRTDHTMVSAGFGLARLLKNNGQPEDAVQVLSELPSNSRHYPMALLTMVLFIVTGRPVEELTENNFREAAARLEMLAPSEHRLEQIRVIVLDTALRWLQAKHRFSSDSESPLLGVEFTRTGLQLGLERALRHLARNATTRRHRYHLVDLANHIRPASLF